MNQWQPESIPNEAELFRRVHHVHAPNGTLEPSAFIPKKGGLSTNWGKYATADETLFTGLADTRQPPFVYGIVSLVVGDVRSLRGVDYNLDVLHTPVPENRAHSDVKGLTADNLTVEARVKLSRRAKVVIPIPIP